MNDTEAERLAAEQLKSLGKKSDNSAAPESPLAGLSEAEIDRIAKRVLEMKGSNEEEATMDDQPAKNSGTEMTMRRYESNDGDTKNDGHYVLSFGNAFRAMGVDPESQEKRQMDYIKVFLDNGKELKMLFSDFMRLPRVVCLITDRKVEPRQIKVGEAWNSEAERKVPQYVKSRFTTYVFKTPEGQTFETTQPNA